MLFGSLLDSENFTSFWPLFVCLFVLLVGWLVVLVPPLSPFSVGMSVSIVIFSFVLPFIFKYKFGAVDRFPKASTDFNLQFY